MHVCTRDALDAESRPDPELLRLWIHPETLDPDRIWTESRDFGSSWIQNLPDPTGLITRLCIGNEDVCKGSVT